MKKAEIRGQKGITLLALVITIAIIIILATITINMVFGDNGLVEKAEQAKNMTEEASQKEQGDLANTAAWLNEVIYGEGGNDGTNNIDTNGTDANSIDTNSIDTNTIEPPPVEIPDGDEEGAIIFGTPTWTGGKANVTISTETEYEIEYQINKADEGSWTELSLGTGAEGTKQGTVTGISHNDTIYARLTDGENHGEYASISIKDSIAPAKANIEISKETVIRGTPIEAKVTHTDNETGVDIGKSKWVLNNSASEIGTDEGSYTGGTFTNNGETLTIPTTVAGEYYLHILTVDKAGNKTETVSNKITVSEITGSIDIKGPTWKGDGTAEIEITTDNPDVTIKYQVNDGEWKEYDGPITGLQNGDKVDIKLTNGDQEGKEQTIEIKDENPPEVEVTVEDKTTSEITVKVDATDKESGAGSNLTYTYYIKKNGEPDSSYQEVECSNQTTYTFTDLEQGTGYDIKVEVTDKAGNTASKVIENQTTSTLPGGEESTENGAITFGTVSWANEEASMTVSTNTEYTLQYQVNGTGTDGWKEITSGGSITGLKNNDKVYVRLTDGTNYGEPAETTIKDIGNPVSAIIDLNTTEAIAGETLQATVTHRDNESGVEINKSKWVFNTSSTNIGTDEASYTGTFTANGKTIDIPTKDVGTYYLHVLTVDKAGNKLETISEAVVLKKIAGDIEIGAPTWSSGTASITLSTAVSGYTIQYKINSGSWLNLADAGNGSTGTNGTVSGLNNNDVLYTRLTNGAQYGDEIQTTIKDSTAPKVTVQVTTKNTNSITVNANATDNESGMADSITYTYYIKKTSESDYVQKASNTTNTYTFSGLTQGTSYDIKVEVVGDKAGNKGSSTVTGQITESLPGGNEGLEQGAISFGTVTWSSGLAETSISTNTSYSIEYQVATGAPAEGSWKAIANNGKVTGINNNSTVYARLTDGVNKGEYASITIKDTKAPQKASINLGTTSAIAGQTITATVTHTDNETGVDITKSKWVFNTSGTNIGTEEGSYTGTFASNGETIKIPTSSTGTYYLHVLTVDKAGNKLETISSAVTLNKITGSINKEGETTWSNGTASIVVSTEEKDYTIEYKINEGEWVRLEEAPGEDGNTGKKGTIPGLKHGDIVHVRLTNGEQVGDETTFDIEDVTNPSVTVTGGTITTNSIAVSVKASDNESGMMAAINYIYYIKKSSDPDSAYVQKESNNTETYIFTGLAQGTSYDIKVEAIGDKAGNKGTGTLLNQTTSTLPGGDGSITGGQITFGKPNWSNGTASIAVTTNTSYKMQYQVNGTDADGWKEITSGGSITGLKYKDTVNVRLTDGNNYGEPASTTVTDEVTPGKATITFDSNEVIVGDNVLATVTHKDSESGVEISKSKWIFNTTQGNIGTDEGSYTSGTSGMSGTFTKNDEKITIPTKDITTGTYYLHVLTVDKAGNKVETISKAVTLKKIEGSIEFGTPTWQSGTASISLSTTQTSYSIQYKINEGSWLNLADLGGANTATNGTVAGLNNNDVLYARLTNGTQYGAEVNTTIKDETGPQVTVKATSTTNSIAVTTSVVDNETGMASTVTYTYYIKQISESDYVQKASNTTNTYTFTGLTQGTSYDIKVEVSADKAGNKGTGTVTGQITESLPGGDEGIEQGAISFGTVTWAGGTASVPVSTNTSFTLEYQVATGEPVEGSWKTITNNESVTGINHNETIYARLTDGINYGEYASMTIKDTQIPTLEISQDEVTDKSIKVTANATDDETGLATENTYKFYLNNELKATATEATYTFDELTPETPYSIKVEAFDKAGNMATKTVDVTTLEYQGMDSGDIASKPIEYYGAEVINYEAPHAGVNKWRIYYADDTNVYLIADDYITAANTPKGKNGTAIKQSDSAYSLNFSNVVNDYTNAEWISQNSKGAKWLSQFLDSSSSNRYNNIRAVAYMMDTNVWSAYYASEDAEYAMGGPTIEMFCESYKDTHPNNYLECGNVNSYGYNVRWNGGSWSNRAIGLVRDDFNSIYIKTNTSKARGMWIASNSAYNYSYLMTANYTASVEYNAYHSTGSIPGLRPIVCLKSDTKLERLDDGTFKIIKPPVTADDISKAPAEYYGAEVINYEEPHEGVDKWRIFYADDTNVYLIADDYIAGANAPQGKNGTEITADNTYKLGFNNVYRDYSGASWISSNSKGTKWLSQYLSQNASSTETNIKAVAYMMDTNVWSEYYASEYAEYAMGGPTIELFCASYKDTHPSEYIQYTVNNANGYALKWNKDSKYDTWVNNVKNDYNNIYVKNDITKANYMWLAAPNSYGVNQVSFIGNTGTLDCSNITETSGPRSSPYRMPKVWSPARKASRRYIHDSKILISGQN